MDNKPVKLTHDMILLGRILHEDNKFITLELPKSLETELNIRDGDKFLTLVFFHKDGDSMAPWIPWTEEEQPETT